jgi:hypothetical protein
MCLSGGGAQRSTGAESSEWKQRLAKNTGFVSIFVCISDPSSDLNADCELTWTPVFLKRTSSGIARPSSPCATFMTSGTYLSSQAGVLAAQSLLRPVFTFLKIESMTCFTSACAHQIVERRNPTYCVYYTRIHSFNCTYNRLATTSLSSRGNGQSWFKAHTLHIKSAARKFEMPARA